MNHALHDCRAVKLMALVLGGLLAGTAAAQSVYRIVGPDGKVTFSDQAPPAAQARPVAGVPAGSGASAGAASAPLPFELRRVVGQFPVTLYTGKDCSPCDSGRSMLVARGIPFTERTVATAEELAALARMVGETSLPILTVGSQQIKGYSAVQWGQYLDAAGYPKQSQLPANYRQPQPEPMVAQQPASVGARPAAPQRSAADAGGSTAARPDVPVESPSGFRF